MRLERGDDPLQRVQVRAMLADELHGAGVLCCSERAPLTQPPRGCALVEGGDVELVHDQYAARLQQLRKPPE